MTDFDTALAAAIKCNYTGVGFAPLPEFNVTILDFDGTLSYDVQQLLIGTYVEYSPSGAGLHAFISGNLGNHKSGTKEYPFGFETFSTKGYVTFTGNITEATELTDALDTILPPSDALLQLFNSRFGSNIAVQEYKPSAKAEIDTELIAQCLAAIPSDLDYDRWLKVGMALHFETGGQGIGFELWDSWSLTCPEKYNSSAYNQSKWDSFGRYTDRLITAHSLVKLANNYGANIDLKVAQDSDFEPINDEESSEGPTKSYFNIRSASQFIADIKPIDWIIKGFLPRANLGVLYGESGSGKSFIALDIIASLSSTSSNNQWNGLRACRTNCLYVVAEGVGGFPNRLRAICSQQNSCVDTLSLDLISDIPPNLTDPASVSRLIKEINQRQPYDIIIMDTFAQVTPGANENSGEDMGKALAYCKKISQQCGAMVLLIHHSGKDASKGARGWSGVHAAADVVYEVTRFDNNRCIKVVKQKDGIDGQEYGFRLLPVIVGHEPIEDGGEAIHSCAVEYCEVVKPDKKTVLKPIQRAIYEVLMEMSEGSWATVSHVVELTLERVPKDEDSTRDTRKQVIKKSIDSGIGQFIESNENGEIRAIR